MDLESTCLETGSASSTAVVASPPELVGHRQHHRARVATLQEGAASVASSLSGETACDNAAEEEPTASQELSGVVLRSTCSVASLLGEYLVLAGPEIEEDHIADLDALHSRHISFASPFHVSPFPSVARDQSMSACVLLPTSSVTAQSAQDSEALMPLPSTPSKRKRKDAKWFDVKGRLRIPEADWSDRSAYANPSLPHPSGPPIADPAEAPPPRKKRRKGQGCKTTRGQRSNANRAAHEIARGRVLEASAFSILTDATVSSTGWQGGRPPDEARKDLDALWKDLPRLKKVLARFFPAPYIKHDDVAKELSTFFVDRDGTVFMFRSYRASWLMKRVAEVSEACKVLVGEDLEDEGIRAEFEGRARGDHLAIIIGYHRQCAKVPILSKWHRDHIDRVEAFLALPIVQRIITWVSKMVELAFPGVAKRFRDDAKLHEERYGIKPQFGLFWNFCINAWFPGQKSVHCRPHADWRNQIGVCALLVYVTESGDNFDDERKTWLVLWEVGVAVQIPPWVVALYPSSLLYHFNVDVDDMEFVTTAGDVLWPTKENSRPLAEGGDCGRGSMVFFNQGTMRHMPETGYDSLKLAPAELRTTDYGTSAQIAFEKHVTFRPVSC